MATYLICCGINQGGGEYIAANKRLDDRIRALFSKWWHHLDSVWVVESDHMTASQIRDDLVDYIGENNEVLVVLSGGIGAWAGFNEKGAEWLEKYI